MGKVRRFIPGLSVGSLCEGCTKVPQRVSHVDMQSFACVTVVLKLWNAHGANYRGKEALVVLERFVPLNHSVTAECDCVPQWYNA